MDEAEKESKLATTSENRTHNEEELSTGKSRESKLMSGVFWAMIKWQVRARIWLTERHSYSRLPPERAVHEVRRC